MDDVGGLIAQALRRAPGGPLKARAITPGDPHLLGHAFKYAGAGPRFQGVYPFQIEFDGAAGTREQVAVMAKAKPTESDILRVYQGLLDKGGIEPPPDLAQCLRGSDYCTPNLKEAVLFDRFAPRLAPYLPRSLGVLIEPATSYTLRIEERLPAGSVILDPDDDTTSAWQPGFSDLVLRGIADIHGRFLDGCAPLLQTGYFWPMTGSTMQRGLPLWRGLFGFLQRALPGCLAEGRGSVHQALLDGLGAWYPAAERLPTTLLYGDVNAQNLAFAKTADGYTLSLFDWERAAIGPPQRDLAEHLIYTLSPQAGIEDAWRMVATYRAALPRAEDDAGFQRGLRWALGDLILNRLPLMQLVHHAAGKRRHAQAAYLNAHRLLAALPSGEAR